MHPFNKLMEKKKLEGKTMSPIEKQAKMNVVQDMRKMASDEMSAPLHGLKKVSVASNSPEGLKEGLDKAKQVVSGKDGLAHGGLVEDHAPGMDEASGEHDSPDMEELEESMGEDLDHDNEEGESPEHQAMLGAHDEAGDEHMSPDEIDARIMELMKLKEHMKSGGMPR